MHLNPRHFYSTFCCPLSRSHSHHCLEEFFLASLTRAASFALFFAFSRIRLRRLRLLLGPLHFTFSLS